jgi:hypothetical protein
MANDTRPSISKTLEERYASQKAGAAFDVKKTLGTPGSSPARGTTIDASSMSGATFQSPNGFEVKVTQGSTQMLDAQGSTSKQLSRYLRGFDNRRYKR